MAPVDCFGQCSVPRQKCPLPKVREFALNRVCTLLCAHILHLLNRGKAAYVIVRSHCAVDVRNDYLRFLGEAFEPAWDETRTLLNESEVEEREENEVGRRSPALAAPRALVRAPDNGFDTPG